MTGTQLIRFNCQLNAKRAELLRSIHTLRNSMAIDNRGDSLDRGRKATDREIVLQNLSLESELLRRVEGALQEIQEGTFGICATCERPIPNQRLQAVPWSPYCVSCQEAEEVQAGFGMMASLGGESAHAGSRSIRSS
ncbi:MAG: TraR/DksA family transcriptional regulator [Acidobacteria bacterium]|nr:TraR/DksA family transcriptional regulator [Acidobacteriota bacterium]